MTIPLIDHVHSDLCTRFFKDSLVSYNGLYLIPSKVVSLNKKHPGKPLKDFLTSFLVFYEDDFESKHLLESELELWQPYWLIVKTNCPSNISNTLKALKFDAFPNIKIALKILATLPITSCECERSFSGLRRVKTHTRTTMSGERLNSLSFFIFIRINSLTLRELSIILLVCQRED